MYCQPTDTRNVAHEVPPNAWRVLQALGLREAVEAIAFFPLADLTRSQASGYLISQRPLREFARDRYGYAHACVREAELIEALKPEIDRRGIQLASPPTPPDLTVVADTDPSIGEPSPWLVRTYVLPRAQDAREHRFLTRWWGDGALAVEVPTAKHRLLTTWSEGDDRFAEARTDQPPVTTQQLLMPGALEHLYRGTEVRLGPGAHADYTALGMSLSLTLEDGWILSRMLDNYDDHLDTALSEYERFRRARSRRLSRYATETLRQSLLSSPAQARWRNLKASLGSRFLPEMHMQRVDWMYGFDCIRGFN